MRRVLCFSLALALGACSSSPATDDAGPTPGIDSGTGVDSGGPVGDAGPTPGSFSLTFGPILAVAPGTENTQCIIARLHNPEMLRVGAIHNVLGESSHHFIVYRTNETVEQLTPFDCQPFVDTLDPAAGSPLMITQRADETLQLPPGVAFSLEADQMIRLELHYINTGTDTHDIQATTTFIPINPGDFMYEADFLFIGNPDVNVPARSTATLGPTFFPLPAEFSDANFFGITGHTHQWGTNVQVWTTTSMTGGTDTPVYDVSGWNWDEPETVYADPPFNVPSSGGFRFTCEYDNTSSTAARFGESANDEMCFFWAYYYPSHGARVCAHTDQFMAASGGYNLCCPGDALCGLLMSML